MIDFHHLKTANLNYFSHGVRVTIISFKLIFLGIAGVIHAILPFVFLKIVSDGIKKLSEEMKHF